MFINYVQNIARNYFWGVFSRPLCPFPSFLSPSLSLASKWSLKFT